MDKVKLKISIKDWLYILIIGLLFGFLISLFFYFLHKDFKDISTIVFSTLTAASISTFSFILITISNDYILPKVSENFWYLISFLFSFSSGFIGFIVSFYLATFFDLKIISLIAPYWLYISIIIGFLTFLIGLILHQFVFMKHKNEYINNQILETKIKALENELNPHFLFNALNSVSELIYIDKQKAERVVIDISKFLRNAITKESLISIKNELDMVKTYLEIENIRFADKIKLDIKLSNECEDILVPKFSIQLLVENAIKHGFNSEILNVYINIEGNKILVSNDGKKSSNIIFGTGLTNLDNRLKLMEIGVLKHKSDDSLMVFEIQLKDKK